MRHPVYRLVRLAPAPAARSPSSAEAIPVLARLPRSSTACLLALCVPTRLSAFRSQARNEDRLYRLEVLKKLGKSPPKKGQGKRAGKKK
jgi:hypothetical protein